MTITADRHDLRRRIAELEAENEILRDGLKWIRGTCGTLDAAVAVAKTTLSKVD